ncbi:uncharacterized protein B0I36DRAFT_256517, partial [Microdochium trichocladiopsis]
RPNSHLAKIGAEQSAICPCGLAEETVEHFVFRCPQWKQHRAKLYQQTDTLRGNLSFFLGGKSIRDTRLWTPAMEAVHATIAYARATQRLDPK